MRKNELDRNVNPWRLMLVALELELEKVGVVERRSERIQSWHFLGKKKAFPFEHLMRN
jgi:hypothetical protein